MGKVSPEIMDLKFSFYIVFLCFTHCTGKHFGERNCYEAESSISGCEPSNECTVTCTEGCTNNYYYRHLHQRIYGTRVYTSKSSICGAAYHDYRVPTYAYRTTVTYFKQCGVAQKLLPTIQQNLMSFLSENDNCTFNFTTPYFNEEILDVATLNYKYLYQGKDAFIQSCQISDKPQGFSFQFYIPETDSRNSIRKTSGWEEAQWIKPNLQPGGFWCYVHQRDYSSVMSLAMPSNADFVSDQWTITTSIHENVVMKFTQRDPSIIPTAVKWRKDQNELYSFPNMKVSQNKSGYFLEIANVDVGDGGIYSLEFFDEKEKQAIVRLIVRRCPKNYYGRKCSRPCPDCRNGGVCHDIMGECICPPGFNGTNCESRCRTGYFGRSCGLSCASSEYAIANSCKGALICLPDPYGCSCAAGYKGLACNERQQPTACDQQKVAVCNVRHPKFENCGKVKAFRDCLTTTASCPVEQADKHIKQIMGLHGLDCVPFDIDKDEVIVESTGQKILSLQERSLELHERTLLALEDVGNRMLEDRELTVQFHGKILQQLERMANAMFSEDNLPWKKDYHDIHDSGTRKME